MYFKLIAHKYLLGFIKQYWRRQCILGTYRIVRLFQLKIKVVNKVLVCFVESFALKFCIYYNKF